MRAPLIAALILVTLAGSCTQTESASPSASLSTGARLPSPKATPSVQPVTDPSSFTVGLEAAGFTVTPGERSESDQLFGAGRTMSIDGVEVSTYEYPTEKALDEWRSSVSPDGYSIPTRTGGVAMVEWVAPPHFYAAGTLLVLYVGDNQRTLDALDLLLGPQFAGS